jgi:hypothetical protein
MGGGAPTTGLRLRVTGTVTTTVSGTTPKLSPGGDVTIEGFDLATGKTLWSYDAGADGALLLGGLPVLGSEVVAVTIPSGGTVALNLATGEYKPISPESAAWCGEGTDFKTQVGYPSPQGGKRYDRSGFSGYRPCDALGDYTSGATTVPGFAGITVDGLSVTSNSSEVAAVPAGSTS